MLNRGLYSSTRQIRCGEKELRTFPPLIFSPHYDDNDDNDDDDEALSTTLALRGGVSFPRFLYAGHMCEAQQSTWRGERREGEGGRREVHSKAGERSGRTTTKIRVDDLLR